MRVMKGIASAQCFAETRLGCQDERTIWTRRLSAYRTLKGVVSPNPLLEEFAVAQIATCVYKGREARH